MPALDTTGIPLQTAAPARELLPAGRTIGHYEVCRCIGRGGMAVVYEARHRFLGHRVAIKVLHPEHGGDPHLVRRFCDEARAAAAIEHPGVVRYLDIGRTPEGEVYLVMELLAGESLHRRLRRGVLTEAMAVSIARQIAGALAAAHARGLVHRDIKPENVFLVPDPEVPGGERVKVLDFGIAKQLQRDDTSPGIVIGTPAYMAPEQCQPGAVVDGRADVYGLGVLLYRMIIGRPPFESASDVGLMCQQVHDAPPRPRALGIPVSEAFERTLDICLAKRPSDRFPTMGTLAEALSALGAGPHIKDTEIMTAQPELDAVPLYPVCDPSPPGGVMAGGTPPPRAWTQSRGLSGSFARDITILRRGLDAHIKRHPLTHVSQSRRRLWIASGGLGLGLFLIALVSLFF